MNILMMTNTYLPHVGGVARSVDSCAAWLRSRGQRVLIGAPRFEGAPDREPGVVRIPAIQHFNGSDFSVPLPITLALHRAVERFRPDLLVLAEAMAAGLPVVAIDAPGVREVIRDRINGRLLSSERVGDFLAALAWSLEAREIVKAGALRTAREFSIDTTGERALALYRELVQGSHMRASRDHGTWSQVRRRLREEWSLVAHRAQSVARSWESSKGLP